MHIPLGEIMLIKDRLILQYIGLGVSAGGMLGRHWALCGSLGYGYGHYAEKALGAKIGKGGFGSHFMFDAAYRFTPHVCIGANIAGLSGLFHSYLLSMEEGKAASIIRCTLSAGIRIHF